MKLGMCTSVENIDISEQLGYDFIEPSVSAAAAMTEAEFGQAEQAVANSRIRCEAFNMLFPREMRLVGRQHDLEAVRSYALHAFARVAKLGGRIAVFGSGGARSVPEGFGYADAYGQLVLVCRTLGDIARSFGITVVIEPLNSRDCNLVNSVEQGLALVQKVDHPNIALLADLYHMDMENEGMEILGKAVGVLRHCHISCGPDRAFPVEDNAGECRNFLNTLRDIGYAHMLSVEGLTRDFAADAAASCRFLRGALKS